jgi:hypothetical protein
MNKIYWWTNIIERPLSDLDLAKSFLNDKVDFKFYCHYNCCWVEIYNIKYFVVGTISTDIVADIKVFKKPDAPYNWRGHAFYNHKITKVQKL